MPPRRAAGKAARVKEEEQASPPQPPPQVSHAKQSFVWPLAAAALVLVALLARAAVRTGPEPQPEPVQTSPDGLRLITRSELARHDGRAGDVIWLALCGQVFDVSRGAKHYGPGGGYAGFAGRDGSRAFVTGEFTEEGLTEDVGGLSDEDAAGLIYWRGFYAANYTFKGLLAGGTFYNAEGRPLPPVAALEAGAARWHARLQRIAAETRVAPSCNAAWSAEAGGEVWCDGGRLPRRATYALYPARCVCILPTLEASVAAAEAGMELFADCAPQEHRCKTAEAAFAGG